MFVSVSGGCLLTVVVSGGSCLFRVFVKDGSYLWVLDVVVARVVVASGGRCWFKYTFTPVTSQLYRYSRCFQHNY